MTKRESEDALAAFLDLAGAAFAGYERQFRYVPGRKFSADFAWPARRLIVEVQGGVWNAASGHSGGAGIEKDNERLNLATLHGWRVLRFVPRQVERQSEIAETLDLIERALALHPGRDGIEDIVTMSDHPLRLH